MASSTTVTEAILLLSQSDKFRNEKFEKQVQKQLGRPIFVAASLDEASKVLSAHRVKVILSDNVSAFEKIKVEFPDPVRILFVDQLNLEVTQNAINCGEVFRFILETASLKEIEAAVQQAISHFDIVQHHKSLIHGLKSQNQKLETIIHELEREVSRKTSVLKSVEGELNKSRRYLEQLNKLIAWINASESVEDLQKRVHEALKGVLPVERVLLVEGINEASVNRIKKMGFPSMVVPLIYQRRNLGNLYFLCQSENEIEDLHDRLDLIKQVSDTVALTLEKIHIFNMSVKRKEEWEKTFDAIKDPVSLVNNRFEIVRANLAYSKISNIKIQHLVGKKCYEVFQKRRTPCDGCLMKSALKERQPKKFELKSFAQNTSYATSSFPTLPYDKKLMVMFYRDQGEETRLRDELIQSEKMAEIGILAGSVAHEINNPLGGILAFAQVLLTEVEKGSTLYDDLKEIEKAAIRSKNIVENLLYFSRASRGEDSERVDIANVIEKATSLIQLKMKHRNVNIEKHLSKVPFVSGDFNQLVQVFLNLFQNALEVSNRAGVIRVSTHYHRGDDRMTIEVSDNGGGVSPEELSKIFNPFFTTKNKIRHSGLGLSVSYRILRDHGGEVKATSELGRGKKFVITLPIYLRKIA